MKKLQAPLAKQPRQMTLLESLHVVDSKGKAKPKAQQQRLLSSLGKVITRDRKEDPRDLVARNLAVLEEYMTACEREGSGGGGGGGGGEEEEGPTTTTTAKATEAAAATATATANATTTTSSSEPHQTKQQQEDRARLALRELSCVRGVDSSLIVATGAGVALRAFRKSPCVAAQLAVVADKILEAWKELVTYEVRAKRKLKAHASAAAVTAPNASVP